MNIVTDNRKVNTALLEENAELLKDRERLEWMIKNEASVYWVDDCAYSVSWDGENVMHHNWRDAVDEAMAENGGE